MPSAHQQGHGFEDRVANQFRVLGHDVSVRQTMAAREVDLVCRRFDVPIPVTYIIVECLRTPTAFGGKEAYTAGTFSAPPESNGLE